ncbi:MAG: protein BatD [Planctomycetes bacterium]|nr:protein BatD [Planctomycetota bacterium]MBI3848024.1 protein BatD [Planctomycetota bacterium]
MTAMRLSLVCMVFVSLLVRLVAIPAQGADVNVYAKTDRNRVAMNQPFAVTIYAEGTRADMEPKLPDLKAAGFELLDGPRMGQNTTITNGAVEMNVNATYYVRAMKSGNLTIPAFSVAIGDKTYATEPLPIVVSDKPASDEPDVSDKLVPEIEVDKTTPVVGECVNLVQRIRVSTQVQFRGNLSPEALPTTGFVEKPIDKDWVRRREQRGRVVFDVFEKRSVLIPIHDGDAAIGPLVVNGAVTDRRRGRAADPFFGDMNSIFDDMMGPSIPIKAESKPITLSVSPLPAEGRPARFAGAVGDFSMNAAVSPTTVAAGDPVTLTVTISGKGDVESLAMPKVPSIPDTRVYDPDRKVQLTPNAPTLEGTVTFSQAIVPASAGKLAIPALSFAFFDPDASPPRYRTAEAGPFEVTVTPAAKGSGGLVSALPSGAGSSGDIAILGKDLLPLRSSSPVFVAIGRSGDLDGATLALLATAPALYVAGLLVRRRTDRLRSDPAFARALRAGKVARDRFAELRKRSTSVADLSGDVSKTLTEYLGDKLGVPAPSFIGAEAGERLRKKGIDDTLATEIVDCLEACDRSRFGGGATGGGTSLVDVAEKLVDSVEKSKR